MKKIIMIFGLIFTIGVLLFFWYGTCISLYVYSPDYLIKNKSFFGRMMMADLVTKTGSCKLRNYDSFLINILKSDIREQTLCDKCVGKLGMLANASLNKKYHSNNIPFLTESNHYFFLNFIKEDSYSQRYSFLGIEDLNTYVKIEDKEYDYMNSLWNSIEKKKKENHALNWHPEMTESDWKKYTENEKSIPEIIILNNYAHEFNQRSIKKWEDVIAKKSSK